MQSTKQATVKSLKVVHVKQEDNLVELLKKSIALNLKKRQSKKDKS